MTVAAGGSGFFCRTHPDVRLRHRPGGWQHWDGGACGSPVPVFRQVCSGCGAVHRPGEPPLFSARRVDGREELVCERCGAVRVLPPVAAVQW